MDPKEFSLRYPESPLASSFETISNLKDIKFRPDIYEMPDPS